MGKDDRLFDVPAVDASPSIALNLPGFIKNID